MTDREFIASPFKPARTKSRYTRLPRRKSPERSYSQMRDCKFFGGIGKKQDVKCYATTNTDAEFCQTCKFYMMKGNE